MTTCHAPDSRRAIPSGRAKQARARTFRRELDVMAERAKGAGQLLKTSQESSRHDGLHLREVTPCASTSDERGVLGGVCPGGDPRRRPSDVECQTAPRNETAA